MAKLTESEQREKDKEDLYELCKVTAEDGSPVRLEARYPHLTAIEFTRSMGQKLVKHKTYADMFSDAERADIKPFDVEGLIKMPSGFAYKGEPISFGDFMIVEPRSRAGVLKAADAEAHFVVDADDADDAAPQG